MSLATEAQELAVSSGQAVNARVLKSRAGFVTPLESAYGAVGGGATDDTAALVLAAAAAVASGFWLDGLGKTYGVSELSLPVGLKMRNIRFKELDPQGATSRKTVKCTGTGAASESLTLEDVYIDRNGDGTGGSPNIAAGLYIKDVATVALNRVEVTGNNKGNGVLINNATRGRVDIYAHDIRYAHTTEDDDVIQGIWFIKCSGFTGVVRSERMGRIDQTTIMRDSFSRGVSYSQCADMAVWHHISRVDQGIDASGSGGNSGLRLSGYIFQASAAGAKLANTGIGCVFSGLIVVQPGLCGVLISAPASSDYMNVSQSSLITGVEVRNPGTSQYWRGVGNVVSGIKIDRNNAIAGIQGFPKGVTITGNKVHCDRGVSTFTADAATDKITLATGIPMQMGVRCRLTTTTTLPAGLALATDYYLIPIPDTQTAYLASSFINAQDGLAVNITGAGTGTHTLTLQVDCDTGVYINIQNEYDSNLPNEVFGNDISNNMLTGDVDGVIYQEAQVTNPNTVIADSTSTPIVFNNATRDPYGLVTLASGVCTWPRGGVASVDSTLFFTGFVSSEARYIVERWDGAAWSAMMTAYTGHGTNNCTIAKRWQARVVAGDQWRLSVYQTSGGNMTLGGIAAVFRYEDRD